MFRSSRRWTVPSWRMLSQLRQTLPPLPFLSPPPAQPRTRGAPLTECRPRLPAPRYIGGAAPPRRGRAHGRPADPSAAHAPLHGNERRSLQIPPPLSEVAAGPEHPALHPSVHPLSDPCSDLPAPPFPHGPRRGEAAPSAPPPRPAGGGDTA